MEDKKNQDEIEVKSKFLIWLDNFWYHYKVQTLAVLFAVIVIAVLIAQFATRPSYDIYIMYAGGKSLIHTTDEDDDYSKILTSLGRVAVDHDEDGETTPQLQALFMPSDEELLKLQEEGRADSLISLMQTDATLFSNSMKLSDYYICFMSEELFLEYDKNQNASDTETMYPFVALAQYTDAGMSDSYEYASERGIYLRSLGFYDMPGISSLPEDTVVCLRLRPSLYSSKANIAYYESCVDVMKNILSYKPTGK